VNIPENPFDNTQAHKEGWTLDVVCVGEHLFKLYIFSLDSMDTFETDDAAVEYVKTLASNGSEYHKKAIELDLTTL
jgi:hypothetical protein